MFKKISLPLFAASALLSSAAWAATPASGVLTEEGKDTEVTWEGDGPYVFPNVTPTAGDPSIVFCDTSLPQVCDEFELEVNIPDEFRMDEANRRETVRVGIEFPVPTGQEDYDLYFYDEARNLLGQSAGAAGQQETITAPLQTLKNGKYIVQVIPYTANATNYTGFARLGQRPAGAAASLSLSPQAGSAPLTVTVDARSLSKTPVSSYVFDFGDGSMPVTSTTGLVQHTYTANGQYLARVTFSDGSGTKAVAGAAQPVFVGELPVATKSGSLFGGAFGLAALMGLAGFGLLRLRRRA